MTHYGKRTPLVIFCLLAFLLALMYAYLGSFCRPMFDDYLRIGLPLDIGNWNSMLYFREVWNGDYTNFLFQGLLAPLGWQVTQVFPLFLFLTMLLGYSWLVNSIIPWEKSRGHRRITAVTLATIIVAATIKGFYNFEAFLGYTTPVEYSFPVAVLLLGIAVSVETAKKLSGNLQHVMAAAAIVFLTFLNAGFSELYLVFQLVFVALIAVYVYCFHRGPKCETYFILALAACLGTLASLPVQLSSPGVQFRSSLPDNFGYLVAPVRDLPKLIYRTTDLLMSFLGDENAFAGFMLIASAALFVTLTVGNCLPSNSKLRRFATARSPVALALFSQLLFIPVLWSHQSDSAQVLASSATPIWWLFVSMCAQSLYCWRSSGNATCSMKRSIGEMA